MSDNNKKGKPKHETLSKISMLNPLVRPGNSYRYDPQKNNETISQLVLRNPLVKPTQSNPKGEK
jgi:hypothetical protein